MQMSGEQLIPAPQRETWNALNDPEVLKACVPGCESIDRLADNEYQVLMVARVGPVSAKFKGKLTLSDIKPPDSYSIAFEVKGGTAGFAKGGAHVTLSPQERQTRLAYEVKASVGGKLAQIGSRLVDAAAKKIADEFFKNFNQKMSAQPASHAHEGHEDATHESDPVPRDPDLPRLSDGAVTVFAALALIVFAVALIVFLA
jgi:uncharacterized protein